MANSVRFMCTALNGTNKVGLLKQDDNGYYEFVVGALDVFNSAGQFYVYEQAKELFQSSSQLMRRVSRGALKGEYGHPKMLPGMSNDQFANRIMSVYEENVCCHHKEITLDFDRVKDENGKPIIAIISKISPSGPMGPALERSLKNKDENISFSIRAFTDDYREGGLTKRVLKTIVTWDFVLEGGIAVANKYMSPSLESAEVANKFMAPALEDGMILSRGDIERGIKNASTQGIATESSLLTCNELFNAMNWQTNQLADRSRPAYSQW